MKDIMLSLDEVVPVEVVPVITDDERAQYFRAKARLKTILLMIDEYNLHYAHVLKEGVVNHSDEELKNMEKQFEHIVSRLDTERFVEKREYGWFLVAEMLGSVDVVVKSLLSGERRRLCSEAPPGV